MKLTILFLLISIAVFAQAKEPVTANASSTTKGEIFKIKSNGGGKYWESTITLSAFEKGEMADFETVQKQLVKIFRSQDSLKGLFLQKFLVRNGVDLTRLSQHPDSLSITDHDIKYILKPKR